jgi:hypothetical protein
MPICQEHRTELGKDRDLCPVHAQRVPGLFDL